ncbi:MAG: type II toxin-antitoxin system PemK/MazF family toxin [Microcystaceae cyanobacterium]
MAIAGQIVLFEFPQTNLVQGKLRPALLIKRLPSVYDDWLTCMISTKKGQEIAEIDEIISPNDDSLEFKQTGLKAESVIRVLRLAVVSEQILLGTIGTISPERLNRIQLNLANWIVN